MKVNVGIYETPQPSTSGDTAKKFHARVQSKGVRRLSEICDTLYEKGINSAQIKAVLDGIALFVARSLREGYTVEMEEIGILSLSVGTQMKEDEAENPMVEVRINGVNFRSSPTLRKRLRAAEIHVDNERLKKKTTSLEKRKTILNTYLEREPFIHVLGYSKLMACSRYQAKKDLETLLEEGFLKTSGKRNRKVYLLA